MSCMLLLWLLHAGVLTIGTSDMFWILSSVLLHTGVSGIGTGGNHGEYCIVSTVCRSIKSSFTDLHLTNLHLLFIRSSCQSGWKIIFDDFLKVIDFYDLFIYIFDIAVFFSTL